MPMRYDATICPHCRTEATVHELAKRKDDHRTTAIGCGAVIVAAILGLAYCSPNSKEAPAPSPEAAAIDACYDAATTDTATAACDARLDALYARLDAEGEKNAEEMERTIAEFNRRSECIKRELGEQYDNANSIEITAARRRCGINGPSNAEEQLREQRERLSR